MSDTNHNSIVQQFSDDKIESQRLMGTHAGINGKVVVPSSSTTMSTTFDDFFTETSSNNSGVIEIEAALACASAGNIVVNLGGSPVIILPNGWTSTTTYVTLSIKIFWNNDQNVVAVHSSYVTPSIDGAVDFILQPSTMLDGISFTVSGQYPAGTFADSSFMLIRGGGN